MKATVLFTPAPRTDYIISYKVSGTPNWTIPPGNPTRSSPFIINANFISGTTYDFKIESPCGIQTFQSTPVCPSVTNLVAQNV